MAGAKKEILFFAYNNNSYKEIAEGVKKDVKEKMPYLINNEKGIYRNNSVGPTIRVYSKDFATGEMTYLTKLYSGSYRDPEAYNERIFFLDGTRSNIYNVADGSITNYSPYTLYLPSYFGFFGDIVIYSTIGNNNCYFSKYDFGLSSRTDLFSHPGNCNNFRSDGNRIIYRNTTTVNIYEPSLGEQIVVNNTSGFFVKDIDVDGQYAIMAIGRLGPMLKNPTIYLYNITSRITEKVIEMEAPSLVISSSRIKSNFIVYNLVIGSNNHSINLFNINTKELIALNQNESVNTDIKFYGRDLTWKSTISGNSSIYKYNLDSGIKSKVTDLDSNITNYAFAGDKGLYLVRDNHNFSIYGFLTVMASGVAIPHKELLFNDFYRRASYLDAADYADIHLDDAYPDLSVGRLQGISVSDVSSYVARDLFYDKIDNEYKNIGQMMASSFDHDITNANNWTRIFLGPGILLFAACIVRRPNLTMIQLIFVIKFLTLILC